MIKDEQEKARIQLQLKINKKRTKIGNGYLLELKKNQQEFRDMQTSNLLQKMEMKACNISESMQGLTNPEAKGRVLVMSQDFVLPNSSKLLKDHYNSQKKVYNFDTYKQNSQVNFSQDSLVLEQSKIKTSRNKKESITNHVTNMVENPQNTAPELDYTTQKKILSGVSQLEEKHRQFELKLKYGTNMDKKQRLQAQQEVDHLLINSILAKFTLSDTIQDHKVYTKPKNLEKCCVEGKKEFTDESGNKYVYDMTKEVDYRGKHNWSIKKKGLNGE